LEEEPVPPEEEDGVPCDSDGDGDETREESGSRLLPRSAPRDFPELPDGNSGNREFREAAV
jgi:hypothetical protein